MSKKSNCGYSAKARNNYANWGGWKISKTGCRSAGSTKGVIGLSK